MRYVVISMAGAGSARQRPAHGYGLIELLRERSGCFFELPEGTVYPALDRLERAGLVEGGWSEAGGRRRRVYALTARGRRAVTQRRREWRSFAAVVDAVWQGARAKGDAITDYLDELSTSLRVSPVATEADPH